MTKIIPKRELRNHKSYIPKREINSFAEPK